MTVSIIKSVIAILIHTAVGFPLFYLARQGISSWELALLDTIVLFALIFWVNREPKRLKGEE
jgi:hypothetical protein